MIDQFELLEIKVLQDEAVLDHVGLYVVRTVLLAELAGGLAEGMEGCG